MMKVCPWKYTGLGNFVQLLPPFGLSILTSSINTRGKSVDSPSSGSELLSDFTFLRLKKKAFDVVLFLDFSTKPASVLVLEKEEGEIKSVILTRS